MKDNQTTVNLGSLRRLPVPARHVLKGKHTMLMLLLFVISNLAFAQASFPTFYVSTTGSSSGNGSEANPWDLQTALNQPAAVVPGSTIYLKAGTYRGTFTSSLTGTATNRILLRNAPGARVIIDGSRAGQTVKNVTTLIVNGGYTWYMGFEVTNSDPQRVISVSGSNPPERRGEGVAVYAPGVKIINLVIYDTGQGLSTWIPAENTEYYGNVIFNNGWWAPDREHGHGIYSQNNVGTKKFINNIILNNFSYGWQVYGSANSYLKNFYIQGNTLLNDRWLLGGYAPMDNIQLYDNYTFLDTVEFGYSNDVVNNNLVMRNNMFSSTLYLSYWQNVQASHNTFYTGKSYGFPLTLTFNSAPNTTSFAFDSNTYFWSNPPSPYQSDIAINWVNFPLADNDPNRRGNYMWTQWRQMGKDVHSTVQSFPLIDDMNYAMSGKKVFVRPNQYDPKRANLTIYNWDLSNSVPVDVTGILNPGDSYELHNVQNYFGDVVSGVYGGGPLSVPMTNHTVALPLGYNLRLGENSFPKFGSFILINTATTSVLPVNFTSFTATAQNKEVLLKWSTSQEQNVDHYLVERSANGIDFSAIGTVAAATTNGSTTNQYQFVDGTPISPTGFYRIREVDQNSHYDFSGIEKISFKAGAAIGINPNPVQDQLALSLSLPSAGQQVEIEVHDAAGKLLISQKKSVNQQNLVVPISVAQLARGHYFLTVKTNTETLTTQFVKQ